MRRTKIVCTIGPASNTPQTLRQMINAGMDVARLNFSHGQAAEHRQTIGLLRELAADSGRQVAILQDLAGPKIRLGRVPEGSRRLTPGQEVVMVAGQEAAGKMLPVNYPYLADDVRPGQRILLADGLVELLVKEVVQGEVVCLVQVGGTITSAKGVNLPVSDLRVPAFTEKDSNDLAVGLEEGVDYVALSFVRHESDLEPVRRRLNEMETPPLLIAKIEKPQAVQRLPQILGHVDGLMVARGDLGVEMRLEEVPMVQKRVIRLARQAGRPVITATQMLRSMIDNPRPTRAEVTDVANAVLDGSDALMLSEETAVGSHPVEAVEVLDRVAAASEPGLSNGSFLKEDPSALLPATEAGITRAACYLARDLEAAAIVAATTSGSTARLVARFRPACAVIGLTTSEDVERQLRISWGVLPVLVPAYNDIDQMLSMVRHRVLGDGLASRGDRLVVTAGTPLNQPGTTNLIKVMQL